MILFLLVYTRIGDTVQRNFLQISDVKFPGKRGISVVKSHALVIEKAGIITADRKLKATVDQVTDRVCSQIKGVAEHQVT